jgi:hypothetical protein
MAVSQLLLWTSLSLREEPDVHLYGLHNWSGRCAALLEIEPIFLAVQLVANSLYWLSCFVSICAPKGHKMVT